MNIAHFMITVSVGHSETRRHRYNGIKTAYTIRNPDDGIHHPLAGFPVPLSELLMRITMNKIIPAITENTEKILISSIGFNFWFAFYFYTGS